MALLGKKEGKEVLHFRNKRLQKNIIIRKLPPESKTGVFEKLTGIRHINIANIYDVVKEEDAVYVIEEYIDGIPAGELIPLDSKGAQKVVIQIASALSALHSLDIIHRDIKPENVMITEEGVTKLIDFDIAKLYKPMQTRDTVLLGTASYAPPEQYGLAQTDRRTDIYSLGILANILVTGRHPSVQLYKKGKLGRFINKATDINMDKRFNSAEEVLKHFS